MEHIRRYMHAGVAEARRRGFDGVVCGHIHHADITTMEGIVYCNTGDWVENCTALTEDRHGQLNIIYWIKESAHLMSEEESGYTGITITETVARKAA